MNWSIVAGLVWLILANVVGLFPSKDHHWRNAYRLIAVGLPLLAWVVHENGIWWGVAFLVAAGSVLRWPLVYLWRWLRGQVWR